MMIILFLIIIYLVIGTTCMGIFTKNNEDPSIISIIIMLLWPVFVTFFLFYILYKMGRIIRNKLIYIRRKNNGYRRRKQGTMRQSD